MVSFNRYNLSISTLILGIIISVMIYSLSRNTEEQNFQIKFERHASDIIRTIEVGFEMRIEALRSLQSLFMTYHMVTREKFNTFAHHLLLRYPSIQALEYISMVEHQQRKHFEQATRNEGYPSFQITERSIDKKMVRAKKREYYYPVYFIEPMKGNEPAFGYDLGSNSTRLKAIDLARTTGEMAATGRITLVQEKAKQFGTLLFLPIYRGNFIKPSHFEGLLAQVLRIGDTVNSSLHGVNTYDLSIQINDITQVEFPDLLFNNRMAVAKKYKEYTSFFKIGEKNWEITIRTTPLYHKQQNSSQATQIFIFCIIFTLAISIFLFVALSLRDKLRAQEQIRINEDKLQQFLNAIPLGVYVIDNLGQLSYINQTATELLGGEFHVHHHPETFLSHYNACVTGTDKPYPEELFPPLHTLKFQTASHIDDIEILQHNTHTPLAIFSTPIFNETHKFSYVLTVLQNIQAQKQIEATRIHLAQEQEAKNVALKLNKEIKQKNNALLHLNEEKDEFLGIVAHDLKNPLSVILGLSEEIQEGEAELTKEDICSLVDTIQTSAHQMLTLIINLLDVNMIESGQIQARTTLVDIQKVVQNLIKQYQIRAQNKNITIEFQVDVQDCHIESDETILHQIFDNLLSNALKYSPYGETVIIRLHHKNSQIVCSFYDNGQGLTAEEQESLFKKFSRLSPKPTAHEHSTGLGLFIVKKLADLIQASIHCESEPNKGACFSVQFTAYLPPVDCHNTW